MRKNTSFSFSFFFSTLTFLHYLSSLVCSSKPLLFIEKDLFFSYKYLFFYLTFTKKIQIKVIFFCTNLINSNTTWWEFFMRILEVKKSQFLQSPCNFSKNFTKSSSLWTCLVHLSTVYEVLVLFKQVSFVKSLWTSQFLQQVFSQQFKDMVPGGPFNNFFFFQQYRDILVTIFFFSSSETFWFETSV